MHAAFMLELIIIPFSGTNNKARELPGAALFHLSFGTKDENTQRGSKVKHVVWSTVRALQSCYIL